MKVSSMPKRSKQLLATRDYMQEFKIMPERVQIAAKFLYYGEKAPDEFPEFICVPDQGMCDFACRLKEFFDLIDELGGRETLDMAVARYGRNC